MPQESLWRNGVFNLFWLGQSLSLLGSGMAFVAFPLLIFELTHSIQQMGLVTALMGTGSLIAGLVAGILADRGDRRLLLLLCDAGSAAGYALIPFWWWVVGPKVLVPLLVAAPLGFLSLAATVAGTASIPRLVKPAQLVEANAKLQSSSAVAFVVGPIIAGVLISFFGAPLVLALNAISYLFSVGSLLLIRLQPAAARVTSPLDLDTAGRWLAGLRFLLRRQMLGWVAAFRIGEMLLLAGVFDLLVYRVRQELHQSNEAVGLLWGLGTLGAIVGSVLAPRLRRAWGFGALFLSGLALQAISFLALGFLSSLPLFVLCGFGVTLGDVWVQILAGALLQEQTPDWLQGRVIASVQTGLWLGTAIGAAATTTLAARMGSTPPVFLLIGSLFGSLVLLGLLTPTRKAA
ncbi:MAG TPA: MFS transporter [Ktedonobacterales bacterium]|nr:MFS transporter [Ktedonobacterales bacterium]